jgi:phosphohistidine phosphatase
MRPNRDREAIFVGHKWAEEKAAALEGMAAIRSQANVPLRAGPSGADDAEADRRAGSA